MIKTTKRFTFQKGFHDFLVIPTFCPFLTQSPGNHSFVFCYYRLVLIFLEFYINGIMYTLCGFFHSLYLFYFHILSCCFQQVVQNWYYFFIEYLVDFTNEAIWTWTFLCREVFNDKFTFFNRHRDTPYLQSIL